MESQERVGEPIVQFRNVKEPPEATKIEKIVIGKPKCSCGRVYRIGRPLRVLELLILVVLLVLTIYLMATQNVKKLSTVAAILLIALFATYIFILSVDLISQMTGGTLPDTPMFLFGVLGFLLFAAAGEGVYILLYLKTPDNVLLVIMILCVIESILFLLDVTLLILNWRQACMRVDKCPFSDPVDNVTTIYKPGDSYSQRTVRISDPLVLKEDIRDVTTSISDYQQISHSDLANLHKFRKIGVGHRREYIDCPVNARSAICVRLVEVQTEPPQQKTVSDMESLVVADVKEEPAQTVPKCPVCANNWDPQGTGNRRIDSFGLCPTFLHMAQGFGMCNCSHGTSSPIIRPIPVELRTESTSATDLGVSRRIQKLGSRRDSSHETR